MQIVLKCNEKLRICLDDSEVRDAALGLLDMYKRLLRTGIIFKVKLMHRYKVVNQVVLLT